MIKQLAVRDADVRRVSFKKITSNQDTKKRTGVDLPTARNMMYRRYHGATPNELNAKKECLNSKKSKGRMAVVIVRNAVLHIFVRIRVLNGLQHIPKSSDGHLFIVQRMGKNLNVCIVDMYGMHTR